MGLQFQNIFAGKGAGAFEKKGNAAIYGLVFCIEKGQVVGVARGYFFRQQLLGNVARLFTGDAHDAHPSLTGRGGDCGDGILFRHAYHLSIERLSKSSMRFLFRTLFFVFNAPGNDPLLCNRQQVVHDPVQHQPGWEEGEHDGKTYGHKLEDLLLHRINRCRVQFLLHKH